MAVPAIFFYLMRPLSFLMSNVLPRSPRFSSIHTLYFHTSADSKKYSRYDLNVTFWTDYK